MSKTGRKVALTLTRDHDFERCDRDHATLYALSDAFAAMVEKGLDGRLYYRTANGIPMAMPKRIELLARRGMNAMRAASSTSERRAT